MSLDEMKKSLENTSFSYSFKIVRNHLAYLLSLDYATMTLILNEYETLFGKKGIKALHLGIWFEIPSSDLLHDVVGRKEKHFEPRTLSLWNG